MFFAFISEGELRYNILYINVHAFKEEARAIAYAKPPELVIWGKMRRDRSRRKYLQGN